VSGTLEIVKPAESGTDLYKYLQDSDNTKVSSIASLPVTVDVHSKALATHGLLEQISPLTLFNMIEKHIAATPKPLVSDKERFKGLCLSEFLALSVTSARFYLCPQCLYPVSMREVTQFHPTNQL
jgi:hypothetical protein